MPSTPLARWQALHLVKAGNDAAEYEDAFAANNHRARFAVADGASEASFAASWARLLVGGFVSARHAPWRDFAWLSEARQLWAAEVDPLPLPWYAEEKREQGAFATFLGIAFRAPGPDRPGIWRALAVGDCCLFHTRSGRLLRSFPLSHSAEFSSRPQLLGSRCDGAVCIAKSELTGGRWRRGDRFLLMTDALARWFCRQNEQGAEPTTEVAALLSESDPVSAFPNWADSRRHEQEMRNDDLTLLVIDL